MKKVKIVIFILTIFISTISFAQLTNPGDGSGGVGGAPGPVGGGAPVGSGLIVLLSMGVAYGSKKIFNNSDFKGKEVI